MCVFGHFLECVVFVWKYMWIFVFGLVLMNSGSDAKYTQGEWEHYKHKVKLQIMTTVTKPAVLYEFHFGNVLGFIYFHSQTILIHIYIYKELNTIRFSNLNGRKCDIPHLYIYSLSNIFIQTNNYNKYIFLAQRYSTRIRTFGRMCISVFGYRRRDKIYNAIWSNGNNANARRNSKILTARCSPIN